MAAAAAAYVCARRGAGISADDIGCDCAGAGVCHCCIPGREDFLLAGLVLIGLLAAIPASDLAIALINRAVTDSFGPRPLPRLDLRSGIPVHLRTMVAVPTLLSSAAEIQEQVEQLEVHYLANPDGHIHFALLSDWADAASETLPSDDELLAAAVSGIAGLNKQHGPMPDGSVRFFLFHRKRTWNESAAKWMGWERKRGKLHELNQLLRGSTETHFIPTEGVPPEAPERRALCNHFGCGHAASAWRRLQVGRDDGASAEPANF